jgi:hypothetical protein
MRTHVVHGVIGARDVVDADFEVPNPDDLAGARRQLRCCTDQMLIGKTLLSHLSSLQLGIGTLKRSTVD